MCAEFTSKSFLKACKPDLKADNENSLFDREELEGIYALVRPHLRRGFLIRERLNNSFWDEPAQTFISFNYAPTADKPPRLAFLIQKTIFQDKPCEYLAQFNIQTEKGWLETTRIESINLAVVLAGLRNCIDTKWGAPKPALYLIPG